MIVRFITHNSIHTISQYTCISQFITYIQSQSQFHDSNIIIYHTNIVNLVQNKNELYKNVSRNIGIKTPQTISHNHIKIKKIKIIGQKHQKRSVLSTNSH